MPGTNAMHMYPIPIRGSAKSRRNCSTGFVQVIVMGWPLHTAGGVCTICTSMGDCDKYMIHILDGGLSSIRKDADYFPFYRHLTGHQSWSRG
jgi:hypothetical protein